MVADAPDESHSAIDTFIDLPQHAFNHVPTRLGLQHTQRPPAANAIVFGTQPEERLRVIAKDLIGQCDDTGYSNHAIRLLV
jgi:hypothetical protein